MPGPVISWRDSGPRESVIAARPLSTSNPPTWKGALMSQPEKDEALLQRIAVMMKNGLVTQTEPFPETNKEFAGILDLLRELDPEDLESKLVISGFVDHPYGPEKQRCMECMYFLVHRKWCDLPELSVPVEPDWWCRLWRI
jgi:hypothetical protein